MKACDFVTRVPVQYLVEQQVRVVGLYLKYWNQPYVNECEAAGICVVPIWETQAAAALGGAPKGHTDGGACRNLCAKLGLAMERAVIAAHDTGTVTAQVGWYFQAFDAEISPRPMAGYWALKVVQQLELLKVDYAFNWTPAARSWGQDPEAEIRQFPSGPFPGHPEYRVDMGVVQFNVDIWHPWDGLFPPTPQPEVKPPYTERGIQMSTVYNNSELTTTDALGRFEDDPKYDAATSKPRIVGEVKYRLMEDGTIRHLPFVEYANMVIGKEIPMTTGDLKLFKRYEDSGVGFSQVAPRSGTWTTVD